MGYALNLCKSYIYNVPYNHNIAEEGMEMTQNRIRIVDVADALGLSTATVSNVIHGKTEKNWYSNGIGFAHSFGWSIYRIISC